MDPLEVIKGYKCPLHPDKSKLDSLELGVVYQFITGENLNGAHDSNAQRDYAVDRNDRESADYTTSIRTNRWYLHVFFWLLDRVVHQLYVTVIYCARNGIGPTEWTGYLKKHGRRKFQIDLGRDLMSYAIRNSWTDMDGPKPNWMRQSHLYHCECNKCFFCLNSLTTGLDHKRQKRRTVPHFVQHDRKRTMTKDCTTKRVGLKRGSQY
jgi:hypothetical protein